MKKVFLTLGVIVLVAAGLAWYFVTYRLDSLLESRIEKTATVAIGSQVQVHGVRTDIRNGTLEIGEISVANPPGFDNPDALRLAGVDAAVDYDSLEIRHLTIGKPEFLIEERGGVTNYQKLLDAIKANRPPPDAEAGPEPEIMIRHFRIDGTRATLESHTLDRYTDVEVDPIEMYDLRGTPSELAEQIARQVVGDLSSRAARAMLKEQAKKKIGDVGEKVTGKLRDLLGGGDEEDADNP